MKGLCQRLKSSTVMGGLGQANTGLLQQEIHRLNRQLEDKMAECSRMGRELESIRKRDKEHIQMLEQQVRWLRVEKLPLAPGQVTRRC